MIPAGDESNRAGTDHQERAEHNPDDARMNQLDLEKLYHQRRKVPAENSAKIPRQEWHPSENRTEIALEGSDEPTC